MPRAAAFSLKRANTACDALQVARAGSSCLLGTWRTARSVLPVPAGGARPAASGAPDERVGGERAACNVQPEVRGKKSGSRRSGLTAACERVCFTSLLECG